jgi:hypothetical protein
VMTTMGWNVGVGGMMFCIGLTFSSSLQPFGRVHFDSHRWADASFLYIPFSTGFDQCIFLIFATVVVFLDFE